MQANDKSRQQDREICVYQECFREKRHYDNLSWIIGAGVFALSAFLANEVFRQSQETGQHLRALLLALGNFVMLLAWLSIYNRNRLWGETANEMARDIEKTWNMHGVSHAMMYTALDGFVMLKNTDSQGAQYKSFKQRKEPNDGGRYLSIHLSIVGCTWIYGLVVLTLAVLPFLRS